MYYIVNSDIRTQTIKREHIVGFHVNNGYANALHYYLIVAYLV
jgi:hypothetical protein